MCIMCTSRLFLMRPGVQGKGRRHVDKYVGVGSGRPCLVIATTFIMLQEWGSAVSLVGRAFRAFFGGNIP